MTRWRSPFLVVGLVAGLAMAVVVPPFQAPDEWAHLLAANQLSSLRLTPDHDGDSLLTTSVIMDRGMVAFAAGARAWRLPKQPSRTITRTQLADLAALPADPAPVVVDSLHFSSAPGLYAPTSYLAPAMALSVARAVGAAPATAFYSARVLNLLFLLTMTLLACHLAPSLAPAFAGVALLPMTMGVASSLSGDVMLLSCTMLLVALYARLLVANAQAGWRILVALLVLGALIALAKGVYAAALGIWFFLPCRVSGGCGRHLAFGFLLLGWAGLLVWGWGIVTEPGLALAAAMSGLSAEANAQFLLSHPLDFAAATARSVFHVDTLAQLLGRLGWLEVRLPVPALLAAALALLTGIAGSSLPGASRPRAVSVAIAGAACLSVLGLGWLYGVFGYPLAAKSYFPSIQGRHLLPLVPWLALMVALLAPPWLAPRMGRYVLPVVLGAAVLALALTLVAVEARYYAFATPSSASGGA